MARTTPVSNGWITLVRPLGTIFPVADATMSMVPHHAQVSAAQNNRMMVTPIARPIGDGGVATISSAAGRNASSSRRCCGRRNGMIWGVGVAGAVTADVVAGLAAGLASSDDFINASLQPMQGRVA